MGSGSLNKRPWTSSNIAMTIFSPRRRRLYKMPQESIGSVVMWWVWTLINTRDTVLYQKHMDQISRPPARLETQIWNHKECINCSRSHRLRKVCKHAVLFCDLKDQVVDARLGMGTLRQSSIGAWGYKWYNVLRVMDYGVQRMAYRRTWKNKHIYVYIYIIESG